jgi:opacity protein-like surface antigen
MKKIGLMLLVIILCAGSLSAQKYYARLGVGVALGLSYYDRTHQDQTITATTNNSVYKNSSLGSGLNINLGGGYMFSKYIGVDLGLNEFIGFGVKTKLDRSVTGNSNTTDDKTKSSMFQVIPALVITPGLEGKINPYGRFGIILGLMNRVKYEYNDVTEFLPEKATLIQNTEHSKETRKGGVALGFSVALGADYQLSEKLSLFGEIVMNGLTYAPTKGKYDEWTINGIDQIPIRPTVDKEWEYKKEIDNNAVEDQGSPNQVPKQSYTLTNVGINIGIKFRFGPAN